jgi:hypothetical protein
LDRPDDDLSSIFLMAEGRQGPQVREIVGPRGMSRDAKGSLEEALRTGTSRAVAGAAIAAVAATNPVTAALYAAYTVAKYAYPIVKAGVQEKVRTGDSDKAVEAMKRETVKQVGKATVDATVSAVSAAVVDGAVKSAGVSITEPAKKFVSTAVSEAIEEMVEQ